jgi:hypothetical protein
VEKMEVIEMATASKIYKGIKGETENDVAAFRKALNSALNSSDKDALNKIGLTRALQLDFGLSHVAVTRYRNMCNALLGRRPVARFDQTARIMVQPVGRALHTPHHDLLRNHHDFERLIGQDDQRVPILGKARSSP